MRKIAFILIAIMAIATFIRSIGTSGAEEKNSVPPAPATLDGQ